MVKNTPCKGVFNILLTSKTTRQRGFLLYLKTNIKIDYEVMVIDYFAYNKKKKENETKFLLSIIIPSPWMHDDNLIKVDCVTIANDRTQIIQSYYQRKGYAQWSDDLTDIMMGEDITKSLDNLVMLIARRMKFNSNKVILDPSASYIKDFIKKDDTFRKHIKTLEVKNIIRKTTKPHVYVVNHNMLFKGDYTKFINAYIDLYKETGINMDFKSRVVLDKNIKYE